MGRYGQRLRPAGRAVPRLPTEAVTRWEPRPHRRGSWCSDWACCCRSCWGETDELCEKILATNCSPGTPIQCKPRLSWCATPPDTSCCYRANSKERCMDAPKKMTEEEKRLEESRH